MQGKTASITGMLSAAVFPASPQRGSRGIVLRENAHRPRTLADDEVAEGVALRVGTQRFVRPERAEGIEPTL
jgi:hypothetical protein